MALETMKDKSVSQVPTFGSDDGATLLVRSTKYSGPVWAGEFISLNIPQPQL